MFISQALNSGLPFAHPDMIGAFKLIKVRDVDCVLHRDCVEDFEDDQLINSIVPNEMSCNAENKWFINCLSVHDLARDDWYNTF